MLVEIVHYRKGIEVEIEIHRISCRACDEIFNGTTPKEAEEKHQQHVESCEMIKALEKVERFRKKAEKILGRKMTFLEASKLIGTQK